MIFEVRKTANHLGHFLRMSPETGAEQDQLILLSQNLGQSNSEYYVVRLAVKDRITHLDVPLS